MNQYMSQALQLAERGRFTVSPNPMVGCVIVQANQVIGAGYHQKAGEPHAEILALRQAGAAAKDATLYVTLEPCCHYGKTPPCTEAIIKAGIKKVYAACLDPNPLVSGNGIRQLQAVGIEVEVGLMEKEAKQLNEIFFHHIIHKRPFVIAKWAMSLDGKTVTHPNDSRHITSEETQLSAHRLRQQVDAILIGAKTAIQDNPRLTARNNSTTDAKQPLRIVLSSSGDLPSHLALFDDELPGKTLIATTQKSTVQNIDTIILPKNQYQQVDLHALLDTLYQRGITSLLVEGGMTVIESFFRENLVNKVDVYIAPVIIGSLEKKKRMHALSTIHVTANNQENTHV